MAQRKKTKKTTKHVKAKTTKPVKVVKKKIVPQEEVQIVETMPTQSSRKLVYIATVVVIVGMNIFFAIRVMHTQQAMHPSDGQSSDTTNLPSLPVRAEQSGDTNGGLQPLAGKQTQEQSAPPSIQGSSLSEREFRERGY